MCAILFERRGLWTHVLTTCIYLNYDSGQFSLILSSSFFKIYEKVNSRRRRTMVNDGQCTNTDARWWGKLTWPIRPGKIKTNNYFIIYKNKIILLTSVNVWKCLYIMNQPNLLRELCPSSIPIWYSKYKIKTQGVCILHYTFLLL